MPSGRKIMNLLHSCLASDKEAEKLRKGTDVEKRIAPEGWKVVKGIIHTFVLNEEMLESIESEVAAQLDELPEEFRKGMPFCNLCVDKGGELWGEHSEVEALLVLGMGVGKVQTSENLNQILPQTRWYFQRV